MKNLLKNKNVGIYVRLSHDDGYDKISTSIEHQIILITDYCNSHNLDIIEVYVDEGFTGSNFDRPKFKKMVEDIEIGKINCVITKDLSRLGRNLLGTGFYIDEYFPQKNIRYISINDNYDTATSTEEETITLKNFINDLYVKECKKKSKQSLNKRSRKENLTWSGCYGYKFNEDKILVPDSLVKNIIIEIFDKYIKGEKLKEIIKSLIERKIECPKFYHLKNKLNKSNEILEKENPYHWTRNSITDILKQQEYTGVTINLERTLGKRNKDVIVIDNTHEAIISKDIFEQAKQIRESRIKQVKSTDEDRLKSFFYLEKNIPLHFERVEQNGKRYNDYYSNTNMKFRIKASICHEVLYRICIDEINNIKLDSKKYQATLKEKFRQDELSLSIEDVKKEEVEIDKFYTQLFERKLLDNISDIDYQYQTTVLKERTKLNEEQKNKIKLKQLTVDVRLDRFKKFLSNINNITDDLTKLDIIRAVAKKCIIKTIDNEYIFEVTLIFE